MTEFQSSQSGSHVLIAGAGLVGALLAVSLRKRGYSVDVYERWPDMRMQPLSGGRSINLIMTARGLTALDRCGLAAEVLAFCVPVTGRMVHTIEGETYYSPYGTGGECNFSVSRRFPSLLLTAGDILFPTDDTDRFRAKHFFA